jgi:hypothetical protein
MTQPSTNESACHEDAEVAREYVPFADPCDIHGVTFDGEFVWFARNDELVAFDAVSE